MRLLSDPAVQSIIVEHRDRVARFGSEYIKAALAACGRKLVVVEKTETKDVLCPSLWSSCREESGSEGARRSTGASMITAHKIALNPNPAQASYFARACGTARFAYNWALAAWNRQYKAGERPSEAALRRKLNSLKDDEFRGCGR